VAARSGSRRVSGECGEFVIVDAVDECVDLGFGEQELIGAA
jgi:hypothetical protein